MRAQVSTKFTGFMNNHGVRTSPALSSLTTGKFRDGGGRAVRAALRETNQYKPSNRN